ncbi:TIGR01777 family protein [Massilia glaciei]|uniref:TIGR01777 family protein n=2 Tax=Massilia glaciei TaxID=1524097 RepID=A0A2U2H9V9_9BURK|nr:TIGR01777 family protein [Massilia glaciei]
MALQGCLGAYDTLYHHELTEALPGRASARLELAIHSLRSVIYFFMFVGMAFWAWHGVWAVVLLLVFGVEIALTLWDFVVEDRTRLLPWTERVTHTLLTLNGGAVMALLAINAIAWMQLPSAFVWQPNGLLGAFLVLCGVGVGISGVRDGFAYFHHGRLARRAAGAPPLRFGGRAQQVLLTGATGFIGQKLVRALLADGHQLTILTRGPRQAAWLFDGKVQCVASMDELPAARRFDVVINLAGARILGWRWSEARKAALRRSRVGLTQALVGWIGRAEHKPALLLSASAIGYYGIQAPGDERVLTEDSAAQPIFMSDLCREWEAAAGAARAHGVRVACMRLGVVFGEQGPLPMMLLPIKLGFGGRLGRGSQWLSWIHVDDVLRAIAHLWGTGANGAYNFTAPDSVTQLQFSRTAAGVLGRPCRMPTPAFPMRLGMGEQSDLLLEGQRVAPERLTQGGFVFRYPGLQAALRALA